MQEVHVVAKFNPSHGVNFWVRCASGNVFWEVFPYLKAIFKNFAITPKIASFGMRRLPLPQFEHAHATEAGSNT